MLGINKEKELKILYTNLPEKPYFSYQNYAKYVRPKKHIYEYTHLQFNHPEIIKYIVVDLDKFALDILDTNLKPNLLVINKDNPRGHAFFRLKSFVGCTSNSKMKPQRTLRLITHSINNYLFDTAGADHCFNGHLAKNPFFENDYKIYSFNQDAWEFEDFFENIPDQHIKLNKPKTLTVQGVELEAVAVGERNCYLFDAVRFESYKLKSRFSTFENFANAVQEYAEKSNGRLQNPLQYGELQGLIKSISKWTWTKYDGSDGKNRGVMELDAKGHNLTLQDKQVLGAKYSHEKRKETSYKAISDAFYSLVNDGLKPTQKAVAKRSGKGIATVKRYWKQINR